MSALFLVWSLKVFCFSLLIDVFPGIADKALAVLVMGYARVIHHQVVVLFGSPYFVLLISHHPNIFCGRYQAHIFCALYLLFLSYSEF